MCRKISFFLKSILCLEISCYKLTVLPQHFKLLIHENFPYDQGVFFSVNNPVCLIIHGTGYVILQGSHELAPTRRAAPLSKEVLVLIFQMAFLLHPFLSTSFVFVESESAIHLSENLKKKKFRFPMCLPLALER